MAPSGSRRLPEAPGGSRRLPVSPGGSRRLPAAPGAPRLVAASPRSPPLSSRGLSLYVRVSPPYEGTVTGFRAILIQHDLILTQLPLPRSFLQIRAHSQVPGGHGFLGHTMQISTETHLSVWAHSYSQPTPRLSVPNPTSQQCLASGTAAPGRRRLVVRSIVTALPRARPGAAQGGGGRSSAGTFAHGGGPRSASPRPGHVVARL